jgi:hypothetical protein
MSIVQIEPSLGVRGSRDHVIGSICITSATMFAAGRCQQVMNYELGHFKTQIMYLHPDLEYKP